MMTSSVALCTYNGKKYLLEQLDSIVNQSVVVNEIVICDDCSWDSTIAIIEKYMLKCPIPIRLYKNYENIGYTRNFEKVLKLCSGDIIFLADQDDIWLPDKVEIIKKFFKGNPDKSFVFTDATLINEYGIPTYKKTLFEVLGFDRNEKEMFDTGHAYDVLAVNSKITGATTAIRASFLPYCLPFPNITAVHDEILGIRSLVKKQIAYLEKPLIKYRLHYGQTLGLSGLFRYPSRKWAYANHIKIWHENLLEDGEVAELKTMRIVHKRYIAIRRRWALYVILKLLFEGEYSKIYLDPWDTLRKDICAVFIRLTHRKKVKGF